MRKIDLDPALNSWKELVLNSPYPVVCCYGNPDLDIYWLKEASDQPFDFIVMNNFDEDDPTNNNVAPSYIFFYKGKIIRQINFHDSDKEIQFKYLLKECSK